MSSTKFLNGNCQHCGGYIEFPAESAGMTTECPHCRQTTELLLATPLQESTIPAKTIVYTSLAVLILVGGLVGTMIALKRAQRTVERRHQAAGNPTQNAAPAIPRGFTVRDDFLISPITLEKTPGSSLVYAVGTVRNETDRKRFGVKVELDLFDGTGGKIGMARDYAQSLEPKTEWRFKALVVESKATAAKLASIKEAQ